MSYSPEARQAMIESIFKVIERGRPVGPVLEMLGLSRHTWWDWCHDFPEVGERYARAQEVWAEQLVEDCPKVAADETIDPKRARVIVDANLRVAALLQPKRFSQAALDRIVAPPPEDTARSPEEIAARMMRALTVAKRLPGPSQVIDGEFTEV